MVNNFLNIRAREVCFGGCVVSWSLCAFNGFAACFRGLFCWAVVRNLLIISAALFGVHLIVALRAKCLPVAHVILQLWILVAVLYVVRRRGLDPFAVLIRPTISLAYFAISAGAS